MKINNPGIVEKMMQTYCFYRQKYVVMTKKFTKTVPHYFKDKVVDSHLSGYYALAVFAGKKATRFISVDVDAGGKDAVRKVLDAFEKLGIPRDKMYVSTSGKKGYHVDLFFSPWIYNEKAKNLYDLMIWLSGLDPKKVEFRPTHKQAVKIPLGVHAATGNRCWFLDRDTLKPVEDMNYIYNIEAIDREIVPPILKAWNPKRWNELYAEMICNGTGGDNSILKEIEFDEDYYESKRLREVGTRHDTMVEIAYDMRTYGANAKQIEKALRGFYYRQDMWLIESPEEVVLEDIENISEWAEANVLVRRYRPAANEGKNRSFVLDKYDINAVLTAETSAARKIAFLIYAYCRMFGAAHLSYNYISECTGLSQATIKKSIKLLTDRRIIFRKSGGCHYRNGMLMKQANTYFVSSNHIFGCPADEMLTADSVEITAKLTPDLFLPIYYGALTHVCKPEYLERFLMKTEMKNMLMEVIRYDRACCSGGDERADAD